MPHESKRSIDESFELPVKAKITGKIPEWVSGTLFKNGPGRYEFGEISYQHPFDGQACVQKLKIKNGEVEYSNKILETRCYLKILKEKRLLPMFGAVDVGTTLFERIKTLFYPTEDADNVNVNVAPFLGNQLYALTESHMICQIDPKDLSIIKTLNIKDYFSSIVMTNAHPHIESDGSWITPNINGKNVSYDFIKYDASVRPNENINLLDCGKVISSIPSSSRFCMSYVHSFGITKNYIILIEQTLQINFLKIFYNVFINKPLSEAMTNYTDWNSRIRVIHKETGKEVKQKFYTDPLVTFHHINAYEKVDETNKIKILVDICAYDPKFIDINDKGGLKDPAREEIKAVAFAKRITIPVDLDSILDSEIYCPISLLNSEYGIEFPAINYEKFNGKAYKYLYGVNHYKLPYKIVKINAEDEKDMKFKEYYEEGRFCLPTEPVFVEAPNANDEDDGVLLVFVVSEKNEFLSVLDAKNLNEIARADIPEHIKAAWTFHGFYADQNKYESLNA